MCCKLLNTSVAPLSIFKELSLTKGSNSVLAVPSTSLLQLSMLLVFTISFLQNLMGLFACSPLAVQSNLTILIKVL